MKSKTILIPINQGFTARYFLQTDIFKKLQVSGNHIVIMVPNPKDSFYSPFKHYENVSLVHYRIDKSEEYLNKRPIERLLKLIRYFVQNGHYNIQTTNALYQIFLEDNKESFSKGVGILKKWVIHCSVHLCRRFKILRKLILWIEHAFFTPPLHSDIFEKYQPDLLLTASLGTFDYDQFLMRQARRYKVKIVAVVLSWDNTTTRGMPGAVPDHVIAWTNNMKKELIELNDISAEKIFVGGVASYDYYYRTDTFMEKDILFERLGLDKNKKLLFFVTKSPNGYPYNMDISRIILDAIREKKFNVPVQLLVRLHPIYYRRINGTLQFRSFINQFHDLKKKYPELILNQPDIRSQYLNYSMPQEEIRLLCSILKYSDVVINLFSTVNIEASILDKPIINICFEGDSYRGHKKARYNISIDEAQTHNQRILRSRGVKVSYNPQQLIDHISEYLLKPEKDKQGREQIRIQEAGPYPGQAGRTIAEYILSL